jgi:phosphohistidine phosphatase
VRVYLCRHAKAAHGDPDETRPLTAKGHEQAKALAERLARAEPRPTAVVSSPLVRARETAGAVAAALNLIVELDARLAPGATLTDIEAIAAERKGPFVTVGHQPDCSEIVFALTGFDPGFPVGSVQAVELGTGR